MTASSIYAQTLGPSFTATALAPVLQRLHGSGVRRLNGDLRLRASAGGHGTGTSREILERFGPFTVVKVRSETGPYELGRFILERTRELGH